MLGNVQDRLHDVAERQDAVEERRADETRPGSSRDWLLRQVASPFIFFVPLRLFIGFGWLRAAAEKLTDGAWYTGEALRTFLDEQLANGAIAFPSYEWLIDTLWHPTALPLGVLVIAIQLVIGLAILFGTFTNAALLVGIVLNVNFMLAGAISPSAFYIVIQVALLATGVGAVFGFDERLQAAWRPVVVIAKTGGAAAERTDRRWILGLATAFLLSCALAITRASDFTPGGIDDPALVLAAVMFVSGITLLLSIAHAVAVRQRNAA